MIKKSISFILALILTLTIFMSAPLSIAAEETGETVASTEVEADPTEIVEVAAEDETVEATQAPVVEDGYPMITGFQNTDKGVKITWDSYGDNSIYRVYYRKASVYSGTWDEKYGGKGWTRLAAVTGNSYTHTGLSDAEIGIYTIRCVDDKGNFTSKYNEKGWENFFYAPPEIKSISFDDTGVHIKWDQSWKKHGFNNGERYRVYRKHSGSGWTRIAEGNYGEYTDASAALGITYTYTIRMVDGSGKFLSGYLSGKSVSYSGYPIVKSIDNTAKGAKLSWNSFSGAAKYRVYYRTSNGWTRLALTASTEYTDTAVKDGETRVYTIRAVDSKGNFISDYKRDGWKNSYFAPPEIKSISNVADGVKLTWVRPDGAGDYRVYRKTTGSWTRLAQTSESSYTDKSAVSNTKYTYTIRMIKPGTEKFMSDCLSGKSITYVAAPVIKSFTNTETGAKMTWDKVAGADIYRIYYKDKKNGWTRLGQKNKTEYLDTSVKDGETRIYTIRCLDEDEKFVSDYYRSGFSNTYYAPPVIKTLTASDEGVTLTWDRAKGAEDYRVYRKTDGASWTRIAQTSGSSYTDTTVESGVKYTYTIRMISHEGEHFMSAYLSGKSITYYSTPSFTSVTNVGNGVSLKWKKVSGVSNYRVYYYDGSAWTRLAQTSANYYVDTTVKDGETRRYTIRCVNSSGELISDYDRVGYSQTYYAPPALTSVTYSDGHYTIAWTPGSGAAAYRVYRKALGDNTWTAIANLYAECELTDEAAMEDTFCTYTVRAQDEEGNIISYFVRDNPYYLNGVVPEGDVAVGEETYRFYDGQPASGYYTEDDTVVYYQYGKRAEGISTDVRERTRTRWLYELMRASGEEPDVSPSDSSAVFSLAKQRGIISSYTVADYNRSVTRIYAAHTMVAAYGYPSRSVGEISDLSSSQSDLDTLAYYGYFTPDSSSRLFPDRELNSTEFNRLVAEMEIYRQLNGKTVVSFGDSIMYGDGNNSIGISDMTSEKYGMTCYDYSVPGAVMGSYSNKTHIADQVRKAINAGRRPDIILINGGTNDYSHGVGIGTVTDGYDTTNIVETTFTGGFEKAMSLITNQWSDVPVIYIRAHNMKFGDDALEQSFGDRGIELAKKWKAATIDLYNDSSMNAEISWICEKYTYANPSMNYRCDSIHPTALGYAVFYLPPITDILKITL